MKSDIGHYEQLFDQSVMDTVSTKTNPASAINRVKSRCEELEDLINELKQKGN